MRPTPATYDRLVHAFHKLGRAEFTAAGKLASVSAHVAKRAWEKGWPQRPETNDPPMPPIKDVIHQEVLAARAARAEATRKLIARQTKLLQDAHDDQTQQRAIEGMAVRSILVAVDALARETVQVTGLLPKIQSKIMELVQQALEDPEIPLSRLQQIITWMHTNLDLLAKTAEKAQVLERKYMGEPDATVKIIDGRSPEEKVSALVATLMSLKEAGRLSAVPSHEIVVDALPNAQTAVELRDDLFEVEESLKLD